MKSSLFRYSILALVALLSIVVTSEKGVLTLGRSLGQMYAAPATLTVPLNVPANAVQYGDEWYCKPGFYVNGNSCSEIEITSGTLTDGQRWFCANGYKKLGDSCAPFLPPLNTFVHYNKWFCKAGYMNSTDYQTCVQADRVEDLKTSSTGKKYCINGYAQVGNSCQKVRVPQNAIAYGTEWVCINGYKKVGNRCELISKPENSLFYGDDWYCIHGYRAEGNSCVPFTVPPGAFVYENKIYCYDESKEVNGTCVTEKTGDTKSTKDVSGKGDVVPKDVAVNRTGDVSRKGDVVGKDVPVNGRGDVARDSVGDMSNKKDVTIGDVSTSRAPDVSVKKSDIGPKDTRISDKLKAATDVVIEKTKSIIGDAVGKIMEATRSVFKR